MQVKEVLVLLTDRWADWEASYAIAEINATEQYAVKTISVDIDSKISIGGLRSEIDYSVEDYQNYDNLAMLILPGGFSWGEREYPTLADFVKKVHDLSIPVAAICGATIFLAKYGFLDNVRHTGDELAYFQEKLKGEMNYKGQANFVSAQLVVDGGFITANETAALEFAREIFHVLRINTDGEIALWYDKFKNGMFRIENKHFLGILPGQAI